MFARNHWYVAALAGEVNEQPLGRTILGEHVVLYRPEDGPPVALADRCPHRRYPLSRGSVIGSTLVCGYHGFSFDREGTCVAVPGQEAIPARARVRAYPLVERGPWVWIWPGDPEMADPAALPVTPWLGGAGWTTVTGMAPLRARFGLLLDNLMDLSHESYLHAGFIGTPEVAETPITTEVDGEAGVVRVNRRMHDVESPPFYSRSTGIEGRIDRWQDIEYFAPSYYVLHSRVAATGTEPDPDSGDSAAFHMKISYGLTPATDHATWDFWAVSRDFGLHDTEMSAFLDKLQTEVVQQDVEALDVLETRVAADPDPFELNVKVDRGGLAARRVVDAMTAAVTAEI